MFSYASTMDAPAADAAPIAARPAIEDYSDFRAYLRDMTVWLKAEGLKL